MLLRCCLIHTAITILRHILYLVYFCPCLGLGLFMSFLFYLFFTFSLIFIVINHIMSLKQTHLFFVHFLEYLLLFLDDKVVEANNSEISASGYCLAFAKFFTNISLALLIKVLLIKKACIPMPTQFRFI